VLPGLLFYVILRQGTLSGVNVTDSKEVYGIMIKSLLPTGLFGVMAAALMAALMGNLASAANSISTLFSYDLWKRFQPDTAERRLVLIGRVATFISFVIGIALVPLLDRYQSIFAAINDVIAHIAPPITCVFVLGVFWGRASARSAKLTMWAGSAMGALFFALKTLHTWQPDTFAWIPSFFYETPFMMMAFYLFAACVAMQVTLTYLLPKAAHEDPQRLYWQNPLDALKSAGWTGVGDYRLITTAVIVVMVGLYVVFH
jgi:SSS family solute:Na+ symporter